MVGVCLLPRAISLPVGRGLLVWGTEKYMGARGLRAGVEEAVGSQVGVLNFRDSG